MFYINFNDRCNSSSRGRIRRTYTPSNTLFPLDTDAEFLKHGHRESCYGLYTICQFSSMTLFN